MSVNLEKALKKGTSFPKHLYIPNEKAIDTGTLSKITNLIIYSLYNRSRLRRFEIRQGVGEQLFCADFVGVVEVLIIAVLHRIVD